MGMLPEKIARAFQRVFLCHSVNAIFFPVEEGKYFLTYSVFNIGLVVQNKHFVTFWHFKNCYFKIQVPLDTKLFISLDLLSCYFDLFPEFNVSFVSLCFNFLSFSQMIPLSSWGLSPSPLPLSSPTSWSPRIQAAQPTSRLYSELRGGGNERDTQGVEGRGWIFGKWCLSGWSFALPTTDLQLGVNNFKRRFPLGVNVRVLQSGSFCPGIGERMLDKLIITQKTPQRYLTDLSRHCQSSTGLVKAEHE